MIFRRKVTPEQVPTDEELQTLLFAAHGNSACTIAPDASVVTRGGKIVGHWPTAHTFGGSQGCKVVEDTRRLLPGPGMGGVRWTPVPRCLYRVSSILFAIQCASSLTRSGAIEIRTTSQELREFDHELARIGISVTRVH